MQKASTLNVTTPSDLEIRMTRMFDAPRDLVWQALGTPELIKRWLFGPPGWEMVTCEDDQRIGGTFRWGWRGPGGEGFSMHGVYREVVPGERVVRTEIFDMPGAPPMAQQLATLQLTDRAGGSTLLTLTLTFRSKQERDGAAASGMEKGVAASYDALDALIAAGVVGSAGGAA